MQVFLRKYTDPSNGPNGWMAASFQAAKDFGGGTSQAKQMREWTRDYIADRECLPINLYGSWNTSIIEDEDFASELLLHLQVVLPQTSWSEKANPGSAFLGHIQISHRPVLDSYNP